MATFFGTNAVVVTRVHCIYSNSVDPDETVHNEQSHSDLRFFLFFFSLFNSSFLTDIPTCNNGRVQIQERKRPLQKLRDERVN